MKKLKALMVAAATVITTMLFGTTLENGFTYSTDANNIKVGEWNSNFLAMKAKADAENIPLVVLWANPGCAFCNKLERALAEESAVASWMKKRGYLFCFGYGTSTKDGTESKRFAKHPTGEFPYCAIYWKKEGMTKDPAQQKFVGRPGKMLASGATLGEQFMNSCEKYLSEYVSYTGGTFGIKESADHRLEVTTGMTTVDVVLSRDADTAVVQDETVTFLGTDGKKIEDYPISWKDDEVSHTVTIEIPADTFKKDGDKATLVLKDSEGTEVESVGVTCVDDTISACNPLWIGERVAGGAATRTATPTLAFGEWTMDLNVAKATAAAAEGEAYTLAVIQGSLWCPDCQKVEQNFLSLKANGQNRFEKWARDHQVALAVIDVPRFVTNTVETTYPTLLTREARSASLGEKSGLGYLTRKGATDAQAAEILERNRQLVSKDVSEGGFHLGTDSSPYRTGVPCFVLLRKDGTVAARLTRWWSVSPEATEQAKWDHFIKRFDEMLAIGATEGDHADANEIANNTPAGAASFAANGGSAKGELSHTDSTDVFKLDGVGGNALQKVTVKGATAAEVTVAFGTVGADGKFIELKSATGKLNAGVNLDHTFTAAGDYYVRVEAKDIASAAFAIDSTTAKNFHAYTITGDVVLVPQQDKATGAAPENSDKVIIRLVKDQMYRLDGIDAADASGILASEGESGLYFKALEAGDQAVKLAKGNGASLDYQLWVPGSVGFAQDSKTVSETVGAVSVGFARTGGKSGEVTVAIDINEEETDLHDFWGKARFDFTNLTFTWKDGEETATNLVIKVVDDIWFDGPGKLVLDLKITKDANGDTTVSKGKFTLNVTENEKQLPGRAAIVEVEPYFAKKMTVYAKQSVGTTIGLARVENFDGTVGIGVTASDKNVTISAGDGNDGYVSLQQNAGVQVWENRSSITNALTIGNLPAPGKTVTVTLATGSDYRSFSPVSSAKAVTIVSVANEALEFETPAESVSVTRYVTLAESYPLSGQPTDAKRVTFTKLMGTLPAGLKVAYDAAANAMTLMGTPTAKAGVYTVVYQVKDGTVAGLTKELTITLIDPTDPKGAEGTVNPSVVKARTYKDLPVVCPEHGLIGTLQVTIPTKGNVSARYTCEQGTIPFSAKGWGDYNSVTCDLTADLTSTKAGYTMTVIARASGDVDITVVDPNHPDEDLTVTTDGSVWSAKNPATPWKGYYTAALEGTDKDESKVGVAPRGYGYLTLKMDTTSACNAGKMTWAGALPNGTAISGSSVLSVDEEGKALVPIFKASSSDVFGILPAIDPGAATAEPGTSHAEIKPLEGVKTFWKHKERTASACFEADFKIYGGYYDKNGSLDACCEEQHNTKELTLRFNTEDLSGWTAAGEPGTVAETKVYVGESSVKLEAGYPAGLSIALAKATGVVSGNVLIPAGAKMLSAKWKGVVVTGWGEGCGCGETNKELPFIVGAYTISDSYRDDETNRTVSAKRGGKVEAAAK